MAQIFTLNVPFHDNIYVAIVLVGRQDENEKCFKVSLYNESLYDRLEPKEVIIDARAHGAGTAAKSTGDELTDCITKLIVRHLNSSGNNISSYDSKRYQQVGKINN